MGFLLLLMNQMERTFKLGNKLEFRQLTLRQNNIFKRKVISKKKQEKEIEPNKTNDIFIDSNDLFIVKIAKQNFFSQLNYRQFSSS